MTRARLVQDVSIIDKAAGRALARQGGSGGKPSQRFFWTARNGPEYTGDDFLRGIPVLLKKISSILKHDMIRGSAVLAAADLCSKLVGFIGTLFLLHFYSPSQIGVWSALLSAVSLAMIVVTFKLEQALPLPREGREAADMLLVCLSLTSIGAIVFVIGYFVTTNGLSGVGGYFAPLLVFTIFFNVGAQQVYTMWAIRFAEFTRQAASRIVQVTATLGTQITLGFIAPSTVALLVGDAIGRFLSSCILVTIHWPLLRQAIHEVQLKELLRQVRRNIHFPLYTMPATALQAVIITAPPIVLASHYGAAYAGYWTLSQYVIAGVGIAGTATAPVFYNRASKLVYEDPVALRSLFWKVLGGLAAFGATVSLLLMIFGASAVALIFGERWRQAGVYLQIYSPALFFILAGSQWQSLSAFRSQMSQAATFAVGAVVLFVGYGIVFGLHLGDVYAIAVISAATCTAYAISIIVLIRAVEFSAAEHIKKQHGIGITGVDAAGGG